MKDPSADRIRFRYPGQPWGPWFEFKVVEIDGKSEIVRNMLGHTLGAWRTNHRYRCCKCDHVFLGGPGSMSGHDECSACGHLYWVWETWKEI